MLTRVETARGHYYRDAHGRVPGVTTILDALPKDALINWAGTATAEAAVDRWDEYGQMPPAERLKALKGARYESRDAAARRGTEVHAIGERLVHGDTVDVPDELAAYAEGYARFLDEFRVRPVCVETLVWSQAHRYAGTLDLVADLDIPGEGTSRWLLDLKTTRTGVYPSTALQLAGYRYADTWITDDTPSPPVEVERCGAVHITGSGANLIPITASAAEHRMLLYVQQIYAWDKTSREDLIHAPISPPHRGGRYRLVREDTT